MVHAHSRQVDGAVLAQTKQAILVVTYFFPQTVQDAGMIVTNIGAYLAGELPGIVLNLKLCSTNDSRLLSMVFLARLGKAHGDQVQVSTQSELTTSFGCTGPHHGLGTSDLVNSRGSASAVALIQSASSALRGSKAEERKGERTVATQVMGKVSISWSNARLLGLAATATTEHAVITRLREAAADLYTEHAWILG
ncbi:hypothetical protein C8R48DRAFT_678195 [Suillus tomentosus]|nr:hypothetical protein C8R48DRAFT_678195 [Suillus tomentosus]